MTLAELDFLKDSDACQAVIKSLLTSHHSGLGLNFFEMIPSQQEKTLIDLDNSIQFECTPHETKAIMVAIQTGNRIPEDVLRSFYPKYNGKNETLISSLDCYKRLSERDQRTLLPNVRRCLYRIGIGWVGTPMKPVVGLYIFSKSQL